MLTLLILLATIYVLTFKVIPFLSKRSKAADKALYDEIKRLNDLRRSRLAHS